MLSIRACASDASVADWAVTHHCLARLSAGLIVPRMYKNTLPDTPAAPKFLACVLPPRLLPCLPLTLGIARELPSCACVI
jgi:hypothetical protein